MHRPCSAYYVGSTQYSTIKCLQIQPNQVPQDFQDTIKKNFRRSLRDKPHNMKMQVEFVMSEDLLFFEF